MAAWYQHWFNSVYYQKLYFQHDETVAQDFIRRLLQHLQPVPGSFMLEAGCGAGFRSKILAAVGFDVTGVDLSSQAIAIADKFETGNLHFYVHDLRLPFWMNYFNYAFNLFDAFGYFATQREHDNALRTISQSLKPGGIFVFDYFSPHYAEPQPKPVEIKIIEETRYEIHHWHDDTHIYKRMLISEPGLEKPLEFTEKRAKFNLNAITGMLSLQNLEVTNVFGDYQLQAYDAHNSPRMIVVAIRK